MKFFFLIFVLVFIFLKSSEGNLLFNLPELNLKKKLMFEMEIRNYLCFKINQNILTPKSKYKVQTHFKGGVIIYTLKF